MKESHNKLSYYHLFKYNHIMIYCLKKCFLIVLAILSITLPVSQQADAAKWSEIEEIVDSVANNTQLRRKLIEVIRSD